MNILFVSPRYYPHAGGVEYVVKSVAERLAKRGHNITVLAGEPELEKPVEEEVNRVHVVRWPIWSPGNAYHIPKSRRRLEGLLIELARYCDIVHIHSVHSVFPVFLGVKLLEKFRKRIVVTPHYHGTGHTFIRKIMWILWRHHVRRLLKRALVHSVSRFEAHLLEEHFGVSPIVIEHGVEEIVLEAEWKPEDFVMYSGRIEKYKNIDRIARIVKILNKDYGYSLSLKIYGEGSFKEKLKRTLKKLGIDYELTGFKPYEEYIKTLSRARLFALLSEKEAYGQTINEANAIGVPAIVAKPWGNNFKDRTRTLVVDLSNRDEELAKKIAYFFEEVPKQPKSQVPSWNMVIKAYLQTLYQE